MLSSLTRPFWTGGSSGSLHIQQCRTCARLIHPPMLLCPDDHSNDLEFVPVSGRGTVETWTVNEKSWFSGFPAPYVLAYVALDEDPRARLLTNLVDLDGVDLEVGLAVRVRFEHHAADDEDFYIPVFEPEHD